MRSNVQMLFHVLRSTAVGIHPIKAIKNPRLGTKVCHPSSWAARASTLGSGGDATANETAATVLTTSSAAKTLMSLSSVSNFPQSKSRVEATNRTAATQGVEGCPTHVEMPRRWSRNAAVTKPTAAATKKHVAKLSTKYIQDAPLPKDRYPSIKDSPLTDA